MLQRLSSCKCFREDEIVIVPIKQSKSIAISLVGDNITVRPLNVEGALGVWRGLSSLRALVKEFKPDVIHSWLYHSDMLAGLMSLWAKDVRLIWSIRQTRISREFNPLSTRLVIKLCAMFSHFLPHLIISNSNAAIETHVAAGYRREKIRVIPNGIDLRQFTPNRQRRALMRASLGCGKATKLVGMVARFDKQKNFPNFFSAASLLAQQFDDIRFVLCGRGVNQDNSVISDLIATAALQDKVVLLDEQSDVPSILNSLDVLISSSHGEGWPNVVAEAICTGIPVVGTDVGDTSRIIKGVGFVVKPNNPQEICARVAEILNASPKERNEMTKKCLSLAKSELDIEKVGPAFRNCYESLISTSEGTP